MQSYTITLADVNVHNLKDLIKAADTAKPNPTGNDLICEYRSLRILADATNGSTVTVGGSDLSDTVYSYMLAAGIEKEYQVQPPESPIFASVLYIKAQTAGQIIHIEGQP